MQTLLFYTRTMGPSRRGFAFGSGHSIPDYVPAEGYRSMNQSIRKIRGAFEA